MNNCFIFVVSSYQCKGNGKRYSYARLHCWCTPIRIMADRVKRRNVYAGNYALLAGSVVYSVALQCCNSSCVSPVRITHQESHCLEMQQALSRLKATLLNRKKPVMVGHKHTCR